MKRITITDKMLESMKHGFDDPELQASNYVVFETVAVTTRPLNKRGTIFDRATILESVLQEMATQVNAEGGFVPLILQHDTAGGNVTPSGKVFEGAVYPTDDGLFHELRVLFAMPDPETDGNAIRAQHTRDIDNGLLDEVSIGASFKQLLSSANPTFDWFGNEADIMNFFERTDDEGNSIDAGETHGIAKGLRSWTELSLVVRGASDGAKISSSSKQKLSKEYTEDSGMFRKLAASADFDMADLVTFSSTAGKPEEKTTPNGDIEMDSKVILAELTAKGAEVGTLTAKLEASDAKVTELTASTTELTESVATLTTEKAALTTKVADLEAQLEDAPEGSKAELKEVIDFLDEQLSAAVTASGKTDVKTEDMTASQKVAFIKETGVTLHQLHASQSGAKSTSLEATTEEAAARQAAWSRQFKGDKA